MKKKILTFMLLLVIAGVVMIAGHEIGRHMHKAEQNTETTEASVDYSLYYTYEDVEKVVSYLADTKAESEALSRLIDPLKKKRGHRCGICKVCGTDDTGESFYL
ncbi:MAG: hypothetical protein ACLR5L_09290 [Clostridium sp.]